MDRQPASEPSPGSVVASESAKSKYRPQQSCIQCRERKVKCDRAQPCRACCNRGLQSECEYITNNEERFQISQSDVIDSLRKEVNRLKRRLADVEQAESPPNRLVIGRDESTSPSRPRKAQKTTAETTPFGRTTSDVPSNVVNRNEGLFLFRSSGTHFDQNVMVRSEDSSPVGQWSSGNSSVGAHYHTVVSSATTIPYTREYASSNQPPSSPVENSTGSFSLTRTRPFPPQPTGRWKGRPELLQEIFNAVCDCDDARVACIIEIIRSSASPEDAMASIHQTAKFSRTSVSAP